MIELSQLLVLEQAATDADLAWRQAKAYKFLESVGEDGQYHQAAFKELDADQDLIELEREARYLKAEVKVSWSRLRHDQRARPILETATRTPWWARLVANSRIARIEEPTAFVEDGEN